MKISRLFAPLLSIFAPFYIVLGYFSLLSIVYFADVSKLALNWLTVDFPQATKANQQGFTINWPGASDPTLRWAKDIKLLQTLTQHTKDVNAVAFSSKGKLLASGSVDKTIKLWRVTNNGKAQLTQTLKGHAGPVLSVAFSSKGNVLTSGSLDNTIKLLSIPALSAPALLSNQKEVLTAGTSGQYSTSLPKRGHRMFSYFLIKALLGRPSTFAELATKVQDNVSQATQGASEFEQTPDWLGSRVLRL